MNLAKFYQACDRLILKGWTLPEIERLCHFRDSLPDFVLISRDKRVVFMWK